MPISIDAFKFNLSPHFRVLIFSMLVPADDVMKWTELVEDVKSTPSFISLQLAALGLLGPHYFVLGSE